MSWTTIAIVVAVVALVCVGGAVLVSSWRLRRTQDAMTEFAERYGLEVERGEGPVDLVVQGDVEGMRLEIETADVRDATRFGLTESRKRTRYRAAADLANVGKLSFRPAREHPGRAGLTVGDSKLDEAFVFEASSEQRAIAFLRDDRVARTLDWLHDELPDARLVDDHLQLDCEGHPDSLEQLEQAADPLIACAEILTERAKKLGE